MLASWKLEQGIVFDTRSILIGVSGLYFGTVPTLVAMAITAAFRVSIGGAAVGMGIAVIITSGAIGIGWRHLRRSFLADITWRELYLFGLVIHLAMLGCTFFLPRATWWHVLSNIALPVMLVYPVVTALLGRLMADHLKRERTKQQAAGERRKVPEPGQDRPGRDLPRRRNRRHHLRESHVVPDIRISPKHGPWATAGWPRSIPMTGTSLSQGWQETIRLRKAILCRLPFPAPGRHDRLGDGAGHPGNECAGQDRRLRRDDHRYQRAQAGRGTDPVAPWLRRRYC